jgi:hypothetical protein
VETKKNRLSEAGRQACSEAGRKNVRIALETRRAVVPELKAAIASFESHLVAEVGETPTAAQRALILAAVASFTALHIVQTKLKAARRFKRIEALIDQVTPLTGSLDRTLHALRVGGVGAGDNPDTPPRGGIADYLAFSEREAEASDALHSRL